MWRWAPRGEGSRENHRGTVLEGCIHRLRCVISSPISQHQIVILTSSITQGKAVPANSLSTTLILSMFCQIHNFLLLLLLLFFFFFFFFFFTVLYFYYCKGSPCKFSFHNSYSLHVLSDSPFLHLLFLFFYFFSSFQLSFYYCKSSPCKFSSFTLILSTFCQIISFCFCSCFILFVFFSFLTIFLQGCIAIMITRLYVGKKCACFSDNICESVFCYKCSETSL